MRRSNFQTQLLIIFTLFLLALPVFANPVIPIPTQPQTVFTPTAPTANAAGYILLDANSGKVLAEKNSDQRMPPASLTKLMSLYIIMGALHNNSIHWDDKVRISNKAWKMEGSRMFVKVDTDVPVRDLVQGIIVDSGNDATVALAEHIAGSEEAFTDLMNAQAKALGMNNTHYTDSTGLPNEAHYSTPHDFAILAQAFVKNFPEEYRLFSEKWFTYNGIRQPNRNRLLWRYPYADGLKTGHTDAAGFCLVGSAIKDGMRLISVIMGSPSEQIRTEESVRLLTYGFRFFETHTLYDGNKPLAHARVWHGEEKEVPLGLADNLVLTIPSGQYKKLQATIQVNNPVTAPVTKGQSYGSLSVTLNGQVVISKPLVALKDNPKGSFWRRMTDTISYGIHKTFSKSDEKVNTG